MNVLYTAILVKYNAHSNLSGALTGGLSFMRTKQKVSYPYGIFFPVTGKPMDTFTEDLENVLMQFNIFDDASKQSPNNIDTIKGYLWDCFDDCSLTVTGYDHIFMQRRNTFPLDMDDSYQISVEYEVLLEKQ